MATVIWETWLKPGSEKEGLSLTRKVWSDMRGFEGYVSHQIFIDQDAPGHIIVLGKWRSRAEIVQHLADSEMTSAIRLRILLVEDNPVIHGYDQDQYATRLRYNERDIAPALEAFRAARATTAQLLERMTEEDWRREGTHTESGRYTAEDWLRIYATHAHGHADQIRRLREKLP